MTITAAKSDSQIKADVLDELKWDSRFDESDVAVLVHDGTVTLRGKVGAYAKKLAAIGAAHRVAGVLDVVDDLTVKIPSIWERSDEDIAKAVRNALRWDVLVPEDQISTTVSSGNVTLTGNVSTWAQRHDAERAIHRLTGVRNVVNRIVVTPGFVDPAQIKLDIETALERQAEREAKRINVTVHDGVVTLKGSVRSWAEKNAIDRVAGFGHGVRRIDDQTVVDPYC